jgi:hypothetical protein
MLLVVGRGWGPFTRRCLLRANVCALCVFCVGSKVHGSGVLCSRDLFCDLCARGHKQISFMPNTGAFIGINRISIVASASLMISFCCSISIEIVAAIGMHETMRRWDQVQAGKGKHVRARTLAGVHTYAGMATVELGISSASTSKCMATSS